MPRGVLTSLPVDLGCQNKTRQSRPALGLLCGFWDLSGCCCGLFGCSGVGRFGLLLLRVVAAEAGEGESVRREGWGHGREGQEGQQRGARD